ncbi:MAG: response regulator transcription factor [Chloroflexi bacterium]|nr:response regulator transcription factor [Chloroflexota bacterium]MBL7201135.1 response regulator transcription factor [Anaerolineae bacterium]
MTEPTAESRIRVLICDDQWIVCEGLEAILTTDPGIEVVATVQDGVDALEQIAQTEPDVVLMDLKMPGMNGIQATHEIRTRYPKVKVLVLTTYGADEWVLDAIRSGAAGYLLKGTPREALIQAVKGTAAGHTHIDPSVAGTLVTEIVQQTVPPARTSIAELLSEREMDVLRLLARGLSNAEISNRLYLSQGTVRNYVSSILSKLQVADRTQAAVLALRYGLVSLSEL